MSVLTVTNAVPNRPLGYHEEVTAPIINPLSKPLTGNIHQFNPNLVSDKILPAPIVNHSNVNIHRHSRTISSTTLPTNPFHPSPSPPANMLAQQRSYPPPHSRQPSVGTIGSMQRQPTTGSNNSLPRRSTSGRSTGTNSPTSYVALMRKQKATVWCDRSQNIDPRTAAAQRIAKQRATLEVTGNSPTGRASTAGSGSMVGKIRHGGVPKAGVYVPPNMSGAGVPMRLSANEMLGDEEQDGRSLGDNSMIHARSGSGKSSINSGKYRSGYPRAGNSPPEGGTPAREGIPEAGETPGLEAAKRQDYFEKPPRQHSDSEDSFGDLKEMSGPSAVNRAMEKKTTADDLRRRGSVDERAMSMGSNVRLFVANPDLDNDSD